MDLNASGAVTLDSASGGVSVDASGSSSNFSLATTANAQDLTIGLTGAYDSSIVVDSSGTGTDAIKINTSAGGIDIDAATTLDVDATGAITLDSSASLTVGGAANLPVTLNTTTMDLNASGAVTLDSTTSLTVGGAAALPVTLNTTTMDLTATGAVNLDSTTSLTVGGAANIQTQLNTTTLDLNASGAVTLDSASGGVSVDASGASSNFSLATTGNAQDLTIGLTGANDSSIVVDSTGTGDDAIKLNTSAGGIAMDATKSIILTSTENSADSIHLNASGTNGTVLLQGNTLENGQAGKGGVEANSDLIIDRSTYLFANNSAQHIYLGPAGVLGSWRLHISTNDNGTLNFQRCDSNSGNYITIGSFSAP